MILMPVFEWCGAGIDVTMFSAFYQIFSTQASGGPLDKKQFDFAGTCR